MQESLNISRSLLSSVTHLFWAFFYVNNKVQGFKFLPEEAVWKCESSSPLLNAITSYCRYMLASFPLCLGVWLFGRAKHI